MATKTHTQTHTHDGEKRNTAAHIHTCVYRPRRPVHVRCCGVERYYLCWCRSAVSSGGLEGERGRCVCVCVTTNTHTLFFSFAFSNKKTVCIRMNECRPRPNRNHCFQLRPPDREKAATEGRSRRPCVSPLVSESFWLHTHEKQTALSREEVNHESKPQQQRAVHQLTTCDEGTYQHTSSQTREHATSNESAGPR